METQLSDDFKEFLQLLNSEKIEYLIVGGYAVSYYGYPRPTGDLDIWIAIHPENAAKLISALTQFGFGSAGATPDLFLTPGRVVRMGRPPLRIEILSSISGVGFADCYRRRVQAELGGMTVDMIARDDLVTNKRAAGRAKDQNDLEHLDQ